MLYFPFPERFTLLTETKSGTDDYGSDVYTSVESPLTGAFAPEGSTELIQGQNTVIENPTIYLSPGSPLPKATDQIRRESTAEVFNIDGKPAVYANPFTGETPGAVLRLERVTG